MGNAVSRGRWGVVNALFGSVLTSLGLRCQEWARLQVGRSSRGLEPMSTRAFTETRLVLAFGLLCVAGGCVSGLVNDALLPQSTQAPLAAWSVAARVVLTKNSNLLFESSSKLTEADQAEVWRQRSAVALTVFGPLVALCGARLDDVSGLSVNALLDTATSVPALASAAISLLAVVLAPRSATRCLQEVDSHSHREAVDLARRAVVVAFVAAWAHVASKAFVELLLQSRQAASFSCYSADNENCGWGLVASICLFLAVSLLFLKLRLISSALATIPPETFMPLYRGLALAANAASGILFWDDLRISSALAEGEVDWDKGIEEQIDPGPQIASTVNALELETTAADVVAYLVGLILSVAGVLLVGWTVTDMHSELGFFFGGERASSHSRSAHASGSYYHPVKAFLLSTRDDDDDNDDSTMMIDPEDRDMQAETDTSSSSSLANAIQRDAEDITPAPSSVPGSSAGGLADWQHAANISAETNTVFTAALPPPDAPQQLVLPHQHRLS